MGRSHHCEEYPLWRVVVRPVELEDACALAPKLRAADRREIEAASGREPLDVLRDGIESSGRCFAVTVGGEVAALFGLNFGAPGTGAVWLLASDRLLDVRWLFMREGRKWLRLLVAGTSVSTVYNLVHAKNKVHLRWLRWMGFTIHPAVEHGPENELFHPIHAHV